MECLLAHWLEMDLQHRFILLSVIFATNIFFLFYLSFFILIRLLVCLLSFYSFVLVLTSMKMHCFHLHQLERQMMENYFIFIIVNFSIKKGPISPSVSCPESVSFSISGLVDGISDIFNDDKVYH